MSPRSKPPVITPDDENPLLWIAFFVGLLPVVVAVLRGVVWGAEPTVGLLVCGLAGWALLLRGRDRLRPGANAASSRDPSIEP